MTTSLRRARFGVAVLTVGALLGVAGCSSSSEQDPEPQSQMLIRKNVKDLTAEEKAEFVAAIKKLKETPAPADPRVGNWYDHFVAEHMSKLMCWTSEPNQGGYGHNGPDLLTWHRAYLKEFEDAISTVAGHPMALPYWDWTDPSSTPIVFADDFMGPAGDPAQNYVVTEGPFRKGEWTINVKGSTATNPGQFDQLVRATGTMPGMTDLPTVSDVEQALLRPEYDVAPWNPASNSDVSFRAYVDGAIGATGQACEYGSIAVQGPPTGARLHATVHMWVGGITDSGQAGSLTDTATSPNDPAFWVHHANIDRILEAWWSTHDYQYLPRSGGPVGDNADDVLWPYTDKTNGDMAQETSVFGYVYDELPGVGSATATSAAPAPPTQSHEGHGG